MAQSKQVTPARARARRLKANVPHAVSAFYAAGVKRILVTLSDGLEIALVPERLETLHKARPADLKKIEINAAGYELYFPALDDGIWLPGVLLGLTGTRAWMEQLARRDAGPTRRPTRAA
jgi:hypothetical protein